MHSQQQIIKIAYTTYILLAWNEYDLIIAIQVQYYMCLFLQYVFNAKKTRRSSPSLYTVY